MALRTGRQPLTRSRRQEAIGATIAYETAKPLGPLLCRADAQDQEGGEPNLSLSKRLLPKLESLRRLSLSNILRESRAWFARRRCQ